jgi:hypothetical protein
MLSMLSRLSEFRIISSSKYLKRYKCGIDVTIRLRSVMTALIGVIVWDLYCGCYLLLLLCFVTP